MREKFLKAKHWQIFIVIFILPYSLQALAMAITKDNYDRMTNLTPFIILVFLLGLFGWLWSIATGLNEKVPAGIKLKIKKFKIFLILPMIYMPIGFKLFDFVFNSLEKSNGEQNGLMTGISFAIIFTFHILSVFGFLYSFYFTAKTYKTVELQREVTFSDFAGDFFMLMFFPIGVWIIQPKINKMTDDDVNQK